MSGLDITDLELLIILQEKPEANDSTLARLTNLSSPTVKRRIDRLYEIKAIERIQAILDYDKLNLFTVGCILNVPYSSIDDIFETFSKNPFIYYQVRCFGNKNGIHASFRIPEKEVNSLKNLIQSLKSQGKVLDFVFYINSSPEIRSKPRFIVYNSKNNTWDWNFTKWADISYEQLLRGLEGDFTSEKDKLKSNDTDIIDIEILSILSLNSRIKNVEILESLSQKISPQRLSDRLRKLKRTFVNNYRVYLNWEHIFHFLGFVFYCKSTSETTNFFKLLFKFRPPPFETTYREFDGGFILYAICPSNHMLDLIKVLDSKVEELQIFMLDYNSSKRYQLNSAVFDKESKHWKSA